MLSGSVGEPLWMRRNGLVNEIWKPVVGFEEYYMVSSLGRVKTIERVMVDSKGHTKRVQEKIKVPSIWKNGYLRMNLYFNGSSKFMYVHRMVAMAFLGDFSETLEVNHKDENKANNSVDNLEWVTRKANIIYGSRLHKIRKPVVKLSLEGKMLEGFRGAYETAAQGFDTGHVAKVCKGTSKVHKGFKWAYVEDFYNI